MSVPAWPQPVYERRRRRRSTIGPISITLFAISFLLFYALLLFGNGIGPTLIATVVALIPLPLYLGLVLLMDRFHPEPRAALVWTFLAGASVVILVAGVSNTLFAIVTGLAGGPEIGELLTVSAAAPFNEELGKGAVLAFLLWRERHRLNGVLDGVVYASMVGLGFATVENIEYYGRAAATGDLGGAVFLRGVLSPFAHPLFTAMTGIGLALFANMKSGSRWLVPIGGLTLAMAGHAIWNGSTFVADGLGLVFAYFLLFVPLLIAIVVAALLDARRERRVVKQHLEFEVRQGVLSQYDVDALASVGQRRRMIAAARRLHPEAGRIAHQMAVKANELAFTRERIAKGTFSKKYGDEQRRVQQVAEQFEGLRRRLPAPPPQAPWTGLVGALGVAPPYAFYPPR